MTNYGIKMELLGSHEQEILRKFDVELEASSISFKHELREEDMRVVAGILISLKGRTRDEGNHINFALGEWINHVDEWFGKDTGIGWMTEEARRAAYRDHLLMLTGVTLIQLQILEDIIKGCCALLHLKIGKGKKERILSVSDFLSDDPNQRSEALGPWKDAIKRKSLFDHGFESRLDEFVKKRNRFVHDFWVKNLKDPSFSNPPSFERLSKIEEFMSSLLREAQELEAPFRGLHYAFVQDRLAKSVGTGDEVRHNPFIEWSRYEKDFLSVARIPTEPEKKSN